MAKFHKYLLANHIFSQRVWTKVHDLPCGHAITTSMVYDPRTVHIWITRIFIRILV
jgi:hypothetical protein